MATALLYLPYLPNIGWLQSFLKHETVLIEKEENFVKSTFRNRGEIAGAYGKQLLSIPIVGGRSRHQLYKDVRATNENNWQRKHWQSIQTAYGSAPFFEFYADKFKPVYEEKFEFLFDFNLQLLKITLASLKIQKDFLFTESYEKSRMGIIDLRNCYNNSLITYHQIFQERTGFIFNLCALDLIFNEGPKSKEILLR